jgi:hypothetical protein
MVEWRFGENPDDGEEWLSHPELMYGYVEYRQNQGQWRGLMVATKSWLLGHINEVGTSADGPRWLLVPTILIVPDGKGESLRKTVDGVVQQGGFDSYSTVV